MGGDHAEERARLLAALRERQVLVERLSGLQRAIIAGDAEVFDLLPIGEGIERREELELLLELGCELGQGHLLAEPMAATDADALLLKIGLLGSPAAFRLGSPADVGPEGDPDPLAGDRDPGGGGPSGDG